jgi:hypothetical protein
MQAYQGWRQALIPLSQVHPSVSLAPARWARHLDAFGSSLPRILRIRREIADRFMSRVRNPDLSQFAGSMQLDQVDRIPTGGSFIQGPSPMRAGAGQIVAAKTQKVERDQRATAFAPGCHFWRLSVPNASTREGPVGVI